MPSHDNVDVAVLGGGPAGLVAARQLASTGLRVALIDSGGLTGCHVIESFPASGAPLAEDIGLLQGICAVSNGPAARQELHWRATPETRLFEGDGPLLLERARLRDSLRQDAISKGVHAISAHVRDVQSGPMEALVQLDNGTIHARLVVDARGRTAHRRPTANLVALPFSASGRVSHHTMYLLAQPYRWLWAVSGSDEMVHGAVFLSTTDLAGRNHVDRVELAHRALSEAGPLSGLTPARVGRPMSAGLSIAPDPVLSDRHILIGDAALARDPIASHGLVHALRSGVQAAIAVQTILDPQAESRAVRAFLRQKHRHAAEAARSATQMAYADQALHNTEFWRTRVDPSSTPQPTPGPLDQQPVSVTLTRAPQIAAGRIGWAPAIELPAANDFLLRYGSITAVDIASACRPSATLQEVSMRLARSHDVRVVAEVIEKLCTGGAFSQASVAA